MDKMKAWRKFAKTGKVADYLEYKKVEKKG